MKKIEAIIRKSRFEEVRKALYKVEIHFFTYWDVTGQGNETEAHVYRGVSYTASDIQRRHISFVCNNEYAEPAIQAILAAARTGEVGDGKIFVSEVLESYRIRTGEQGSVSLKENR
ncbi:MAG: transcriptional regulator [Flavobacteriaceae bacterium]|nr:MAG: transcriptional regulator [Flavobacteriaceae bacterium]